VIAAKQLVLPLRSSSVTASATRGFDLLKLRQIASFGMTQSHQSLYISKKLTTEFANTTISTAVLLTYTNLP
jgi:phage FluMu protein gp41